MCSLHWMMHLSNTWTCLICYWCSFSHFTCLQYTSKITEIVFLATCPVILKGIFSSHVNLAENGLGHPQEDLRKTSVRGSIAKWFKDRQYRQNAAGRTSGKRVKPSSCHYHPPDKSSQDTEERINSSCTCDNS